MDPIEAAAKSIFLSLQDDSEQKSQSPFLKTLDREGNAFVVDNESLKIAYRVRAQLRALSDALYIVYDKRRAEEDWAGAREVDRLLGQVDVLSISIERQIIAYIDNSPDVAAAKAKIQDVGRKLDQVTAQAKSAAQNYSNVAGVLNLIAKVVGWL